MQTKLNQYNKQAMVAPRVGIYPGTFDPLHDGHIAFALEAARRCGLGKVVLLPEPWPRDKDGVTAIKDRTLSIKNALTPYEQLKVVRLQSSQFTVLGTLPELVSLCPDTKLVLLIGSDVAYRLHAWPGLALLLQTVDLAVGMRSNHKTDTIRHLVSKLEKAHGLSISYELIETPYPQLASSQFRAS